MHIKDSLSQAPARKRGSACSAFHAAPVQFRLGIYSKKEVNEGVVEKIKVIIATGCGEEYVLNAMKLAAKIKKEYPDAKIRVKVSA